MAREPSGGRGMAGRKRHLSRHGKTKPAGAARSPSHLTTAHLSPGCLTLAHALTPST
jgi:hypothetical protein